MLFDKSVKKLPAHARQTVEVLGIIVLHALAYPIYAGAYKGAFREFYDRVSLVVGNIQIRCENFNVFGHGISAGFDKKIVVYFPPERLINMKHGLFVFKSIFKNNVDAVLKAVKGRMIFNKLVGLVGNNAVKQGWNVLKIIVKGVSADPAAVNNIFHAYFA